MRITRISILLAVFSVIPFTQSTPKHWELLSLIPSANTCVEKRITTRPIKFSSDSKYLLANWADYSNDTPSTTIRIWNIETANVISELSNKYLNSDDVFAVSSDTQYVISGGSKGVTILWDTFSGKTVAEFIRDENVPVPITNVYFSPDDKYVLILDYFAASLWSIETRTKVYELPVKSQDAAFANFSPDGAKLIIEKQVLDVETKQMLYSFESKIFEAMFSPDGKYIFTEGIDGDSLWDSSTFQEVHKFEGTFLHDDYRNWIFSKNTLYMASEEEPDAVIIWDVRTGKLLHRLMADSPVRDAVFLLDGKQILLNDKYGLRESNRTDSIYSVYDTDSGKKLKEIIVEHKLRTGPSFRVSPNGKYLLTWNDLGSLTLWDIESGIFLRQFC